VELLSAPEDPSILLASLSAENYLAMRDGLHLITAIKAGTAGGVELLSAPEDPSILLSAPEDPSILLSAPEDPSILLSAPEDPSILLASLSAANYLAVRDGLHLITAMSSGQ
jgi:hypothetical protein